MNIEKIFRVLEICIPVFVLIGLGKVLSMKNIMSADNRLFINKIVYNLCIPALIIYNTVKQPFNKILNYQMVVSCAGALVCIIIVYFLLSRILRVSNIITGGFIAGAFWGNVAYMGFPLSSAAFGAEKGFLNATIINAFVNILFVTLGVILISFFIKKENTKIKDTIKGAVLNPVVLSALTGIAISFSIDLFLDRSSLPEAVIYPAGIIGETLKLAGSMGLPLALIAIGGSLKIKYISEQKWTILLTSLGKVIIMPLFTLLFFYFVFPDTGLEEQGTAVLLMGMPSAVAVYIVYKQLGGEEGFMSSVLVISTVMSIVTIPVWLYIIL